MSKSSPVITYALLLIASLLWGANVVFGRLAVGQISPLQLVTLRFLIVSLAMMLFFGRRLRKDIPVLRRHLLLLFALGISGFSGFTILFYMGAHYTSGANMAIIPGATPFLVFLLVWLSGGRRITLWQWAGIVLGMAGVVLVAAHGSWAELRRLQFNTGDVCLITGTCLYALYTVGLAHLPKEADIMSVLAVLAMVAFVTALPFAVYEALSGTAGWPTAKGWGLTFIIALFPCFLSQVFYIRGVAAVGAGRAGIFNNLVPVFGAGLSVIFLGEAMGRYQIIGLVLVMAGIICAQARGRGPGRDPSRAG